MCVCGSMRECVRGRRTVTGVPVSSGTISGQLLPHAVSYILSVVFLEFDRNLRKKWPRIIYSGTNPLLYYIKHVPYPKMEQPDYFLLNPLQSDIVNRCRAIRNDSTLQQNKTTKWKMEGGKNFRGSDESGGSSKLRFVLRVGDSEIYSCGQRCY